jgi:hypothetical protein
MLAAARKVLRRARRVVQHAPAPKRRALRALIADVDVMLELAESAAARVCSTCGHSERKRGRGWCEQWIKLEGSTAELACCKSACSYDAT